MREEWDVWQEFSVVYSVNIGYLNPLSAPLHMHSCVAVAGHTFQQSLALSCNCSPHPQVNAAAESIIKVLGPPEPIPPDAIKVSLSWWLWGRLLP